MELFYEFGTLKIKGEAVPEPRTLSMRISNRKMDNTFTGNSDVHEYVS